MMKKVGPPPPANAHANSLETIAIFPEEGEKRAKAKREAKVAKKNQVEQRNVELTRQDVQEKKDGLLPNRKRRRGSLFPLVLQERNQLPKNQRRHLLLHLMIPLMIMLPRKLQCMINELFWTSRIKLPHQKNSHLC